MDDKEQVNLHADKKMFVLPGWFNVLIVSLIALSLFTFKKFEGKSWETSIGINQTTPIIIAFAILPFVMTFLMGRSDKGTVELAGCKFSWENKKELDDEIRKEQEKHKEAGESVKTSDFAVNAMRELLNHQRQADIVLEKKVRPEDLSIVRHLYMQELHDLVKKYNHNRHLRQLEKSTAGEADEITYRIRAISPFLFGQFDVTNWLNSRNPGKRLAAVKYLDWAQDIEYVEALLNLLTSLGADTFQQFHVLLALSGMTDQIAYDLKETVKNSLVAYAGGSDQHLVNLKNRILEEVS